MLSIARAAVLCLVSISLGIISTIVPQFAAFFMGAQFILILEAIILAMAAN